MIADGIDHIAACATLAGEPPPKPNGKGAAANPKKIVAARFDYSDEGGNLLFQVERVEYRNADGTYVTKDGKRKKTFLQRRPDPDQPSKWIWDVDGVRAVPYRLPELLACMAASPGDPIIIAEGEAKVDALVKWDLIATCNARGAEKWSVEHSVRLRGADVVILPDNDKSGRAHRDVVGRSLQGIAKRVRVLELPDLPLKGDVKDWIAAGGTRAQFLDLLGQAWDWTAPGSSEQSGPDEQDHSLDWPPLDRALLNDDHLPAPAFDREVLPPAWVEWTDATAQDCGAPPDYVFANLIGVASAVIGNACPASPWEGWIEQPQLWIATVGNPSSNKTPALAPIRAACVAIEQSLQPAHDDAMATFNARKETAAAAKAIWKDRVKDAAKKGEKAPTLPQDAVAPDQPKPPRLLIADASTEEAQSLLASNPRGLALVRSELAAWLGQFDRYGGAGADRGFYLECWDGGPHSVDRVKFDGRVLRLPYASLAIIGSIQPDKLAEVFNTTDDGLTARFLYIFPEPIPPRPCQITGANERSAKLRNAFSRLRLLGWDRDRDGNEIPLLLRLDLEGLDLLQAIREETYMAIQTGRGAMTTWRGKTPGRLLRLALVFELLEWSLSDDPHPYMISGDSVRRATAYLRYCAAMMERVLGDLAFIDAQRDAAELARFILTDKPATLNERQVYQSRGFSRLRDPQRRKAALAELHAAGWIRKIDTANLGRPAGDWEINPATASLCQRDAGE